MIDAYKHVIDHEDIYRKYLDLIKEVYKIPEEDRTHILLVFAGNALHDLPDNIIQTFFDGYFDLREQVKEFCGENK